MKVAVYKGYAISPYPRKHHDGSWEVNFYIGRQSRPGASGRLIKLPIRFSEKDEAVRWCYPAGRGYIEHYV